MKRTLILAGVAAVFISVGVVWGALPAIDTVTAPAPAGGLALLTAQSPYAPLRVVTASDTPLSTTTKAWSTIKAVFVAVPKGANCARISCYADGDGSGTGDPNGGSFSYKVMVCERYSSAKLVGTGTWAIGELALSHNPASGSALTYGVTDPNATKWGELPVVTTDEWGGVYANGTSNDVGELKFDLYGSAGLWVEVTSLTGLTNLVIVVKWW